MTGGGGIIKICGITTAEDAAAACKAGATALGFNFYPKSPRYIAVETAKAIAASLPSSVLRVGVFVQPTGAEVRRILADAGLDVAQVHGAFTEDAAPLRLWRAVPVDEAFRSDRLKEYEAEAVMLDTPTSAFGGSGRVFEWDRVRATSVRLIVAGGLDGGNVEAAIRTLRPWGVDACSRLESAPGTKDAEKMRRFAAAAQAAFRAIEKDPAA
jgi:phosphoribosylanthranilate isomerase